MPGFLSRLKARDGSKKKKNNAKNLAHALPQKPLWDDAYARSSVDPDEVHELLHFCTMELKARGLDIPFLLLPYRPTSDPSAVRTFIRHYFDNSYGLKGEFLSQELRMIAPMVISGVAKWCWARLPGGIVGWDSYELFKIGEGDSRMARDSFKTFIPLSVESGARQRIIFDFFELIAAVAAHGKNNGLGGRQLSRMAAWWTFEHKDTGSGFDGGYRAWLKAADATTHLFFAYLRSISPEEGLTGISMLPRSLEKLLNETRYPPSGPIELMTATNKLVMLVDSVSPTPFALLRRAGHFQYRDSDPALQEFSEYEDPVHALTEECRRVLRAISAANESQVSSAKHSTSLRDASWSRFEDIGFSDTVAEELQIEDSRVPSHSRRPHGLRNEPLSGMDLGRPTTPSWADFLSSGFVDDNQNPSNILLPPDKVLPPIETQVRQHSSQSHRPRLESGAEELQPGELASITVLNLDNAFWWVWMNSLAPEETSERKSAFGRCAVIETKVAGGHWLVMEEMIASAAPQQEEGAYIAEKKSLFSWTKRGRSVARRKSARKHASDRGDKNGAGDFGASKSSVGPDTHARIQAKAAQMRALQESELQESMMNARRGRMDDAATEKTNSVLTLQPQIAGEASSAMKWVKRYDKNTIRDAYMANTNAGRGVAVPFPPMSSYTDASSLTNGHGDSLEQNPALPDKDSSPVQSPMANTTPLESPLPREELPEQRPSPPEKPRNAFFDPVVHESIDAFEDEPTAPLASPSAGDEAAGETLKPPKNKNAAPAKDKKGFRNLLRRKNRGSRLPDNAAVQLAAMLPQESPITKKPVPEAPREETSEDFDNEDALPITEPIESPRDFAGPSPGASPNPEWPSAANNEPTYDPVAGEELSHIDTQDVEEAQQEFSRFDQGPLPDQPAFSPEEDDDASPPPIATHRPVRREGGKRQSDGPIEKLNQGAGPGVQDRWAQIRKNAAQRAASRQRDEAIRHNRALHNTDNEPVEEESIESRVARIKARVAELTGNMETSNGARAPVAGRT